MKAILEEFDQAEEDADNDEQAAAPRLIDRDTIETTDFTVVGKIVQQEFEIGSHYGVLKVKLSDIRRIEREVARKAGSCKNRGRGWHESGHAQYQGHRRSRRARRQDHDLPPTARSP